MKKALVISGGGSKGAFAGGVAQYLLKNEEKAVRLIFRDFYGEFNGISFSSWECLMS